MASHSSTSSSEPPIGPDSPAGKKPRLKRDPYSSTNPPDGFLDFIGHEPARRRPAASGFPWAGALALLLIFVVVEWGLLGPSGPWPWLHSQLLGVDPLERGLIDDRLALQRALNADPDRPRVTLVGTSRTNAGFQPELINDSLTPPIDFIEMTHTRVFPHELRSMIDDVIASKPDVLLTVLSELEFFTPLKIVPLATGGGLGALVELAAATGPLFILENREVFYRMLTVVFSDAYRYRGVLGKTIFDRHKSFPVEQRPQADRPQTWPDLMADGEPMPLDPAVEMAIGDSLRAFYGSKDHIIKAQMAMLRSMRNGRHAQIKMDAMDRCLELLTAEGIEVLIVEGSIHPETLALYDAVEGRKIFTAWAEKAAEHPGVHFLPVESFVHFENLDFRDLTHLNKNGAAKFTLAAYDWCSQRLAPEWREAVRAALLDGDDG
ncbi:MAG: hypothetical protein ACI9EF_001495 [Pseudohongiellaceae bacterium]